MDKESGHIQDIKLREAQEYFSKEGFKYFVYCLAEGIIIVILLAIIFIWK